MFHLLDAGIDAGQHEGGGKSIEVRRFGFNLDHGGVNGGLRVMVDNVPQNYGTQGHGQGYLGSLKSLSPELVDEVTLINGPFRPVSVIKETALEGRELRATAKAASADLRLRTLNTVKLL